MEMCLDLMMMTGPAPLVYVEIVPEACQVFWGDRGIHMQTPRSEDSVHHNFCISILFFIIIPAV